MKKASEIVKEIMQSLAALRTEIVKLEGGSVVQPVAPVASAEQLLKEMEKEAKKAGGNKK